MYGLSLQLLQLRPSIYGWLASSFFPEPTSETIERARNLLSSWIDVFQEDPARLTRLQEVSDSLSFSDPERLAVDYAGLFLGGKEGAFCPSESSYREGKIYGDTTLRVIDFYRQNGFMKDPAFPEPDDHVAIEFAFMSLLASHSFDLGRDFGLDSPQCRKELRAQLIFLNEHILAWVPACLKRLLELSETEFYKALARFTGSWMEDDAGLLLRTLGPSSPQIA